MPPVFATYPSGLLVLSPRLTRTGDPAGSVAGINTTQLADGCFVYCEENKREYQLDRTSVAPPDGDSVIEPVGPGRWLLALGGLTGPTGPIGPVGTTGDTGATGPTGSSGILTFADPGEVAAYDATDTPDFMLASVGVVVDSYRYLQGPSMALLAAADGINVIAPAAPANTVFMRLYVRNLQAQYQSTWYVDPVSGSDASGGDQVMTPLKTLAELSNRLRGATINQDVTVNLAAGTLDDLTLDVTLASGVSILILGNVTSSASDLLAASLGTVPGAAGTNSGAQRATVTATALAFTDQQRLRMVDGAAQGAFAWVTKVTTPGAGGVANVSRWGKLATVRTSTSVTLTEPLAADSYVQDTLNTVIGRVDLRARGSGRIILQDCDINTAATVAHRGVCDNSTTNGVQLYGCRIRSGGSVLFEDGEFTLTNCQIGQGSTVIFSKGFFIPRTCVFTGGVQVWGGGVVNQNDGACFDGTNLIVYQGLYDVGTGTTANDAQWVDGTTNNAIELDPAGMINNHGSNNQMWGLDNGYAGVAIRVFAGAHYAYASKPSIPGGTGNDFNIGGTTGLYAALPVFRTTAAGGGASVTSQ